MGKRSAIRTSRRVAARAAQVAWQAPQVATARLGRIAAAGASPSVADGREVHRMVAEKAAAFAESWQAMAWQGVRWQQQAWATWWRPFPPVMPMTAATQAWHAALRVVDQGLAPVHRRVGANARRLSAKRR
jgi:hypothetical protein